MAPKVCPICKKESAPEFKPFCSERCKNVDLGLWLTGQYRIETDEGDNAQAEILKDD